MNGVQRLREKRGEQEVTFDDIAGHLEDFVERHPEDTSVVDRLAAFLAAVEDVDHEHDGAGPALG